jgi:hypothetical protein
MTLLRFALLLYSTIHRARKKMVDYRRGPQLRLMTHTETSAGERFVTPYSGRNLDVKKGSFNFYFSSLRIFVEQVFGVIVKIT